MFILLPTALPLKTVPVVSESYRLLLILHLRAFYTGTVNYLFALCASDSIMRAYHGSIIHESPITVEKLFYTVKGAAIKISDVIIDPSYSEGVRYIKFNTDLTCLLDPFYVYKYACTTTKVEAYPFRGSERITHLISLVYGYAAGATQLKRDYESKFQVPTTFWRMLNIPKYDASPGTPLPPLSKPLAFVTSTSLSTNSIKISLIMIFVFTLICLLVLRKKKLKAAISNRL